jgi:hypothetical protein
MGEKQRIRQRPDATRHRSDRRRDAPHRLEVDVTDDHAVDDVDPDVDDHDAPSNHVAPNEAGVPGGDDQDLGVPHVASEIARS